MKKIWTSFFLILAIGCALSLMYFVFTLSPVSAVSTEIEPGTDPFLITKGDGFKYIAAQLVKEGYIRSARAFSTFAIITGRAHQFKPGAYDLDPASSTPEIVDLLARGPEPDRKVLIREGMNIQEINDLLTAQGVLEKNALVKFDWRTLVDQYPFLAKSVSLEGFLLPDTYRFYVESYPDAVAKIFLDNFKSRAWPILSRNNKTPYRTLIIASMLEKEVPESEDRLIVAGIIERRLKIGMPLQIDATLPYARVNGQAYDTYKNYGLPPGPISNPGLDAISAALHPKTSPYLYYLSDPKTGKTIFSKTFDEHDTNRAKYLR